MMLKRTFILLIAVAATMMPYASLLLCACEEDCHHCNEEQTACHSIDIQAEPSCCSAMAEATPADTKESHGDAHRVIDTQCACSHGSSAESVALVPTTSRKVPVPALSAITSFSVTSSHSVPAINSGHHGFVPSASWPTHVLHCVFLC